MAWETAEPPASEQPQIAGSARDERGAASARGERFGPLAVERYAKDDGRALILYRHEGQAQE
jgi:hypothetical protein